MAERDCAAVDVDDRGIESGYSYDGERLGRERLVEFDDADVAELETGERHRFRDRDHGTDTHDLGWNAGGGETDKAGFRFEAELVRLRGGHDESCRGAIAGLRRVAR